MPVRFTYSTTNIEIRNPERENVYELKKYQQLGRTAAGQVFVYEKGVETKKLELEFKNLRESEKDDLESFFDSTVDGIMNQFTYVNHRGETYTARLLDPVLRFTETRSHENYNHGYNNLPGQRFNKGSWSISIKLEIQ